VSGSAQCRSSSTTTSPAGRASHRSNRSTASPLITVDGSPAAPPSSPRLAGQFPGQARLADTGLSGNEHHPAGTGQRGDERVVQRA
jgi:hypothetical protein